MGEAEVGYYYISGRAVVHGVTSGWQPVISGVSQGFILIFFNVFINDLDVGLQGVLSKFADNTKVGGAVDAVKGEEDFQKDLDKLESWAITNHMLFSRLNARFCT